MKLEDRKYELLKIAELLDKGDAISAYDELQALLSFSRAAGNHTTEAAILHLMGVAAHDLGHLEEARLLIEKSLMLKSDIGDK